MSDFLIFLYAGYIKPYIESRSLDDGETLHHSLWENDNTEEQRGDAEVMFRFYAVQGFLLGLRTGTGLAEDL